MTSSLTVNAHPRKFSRSNVRVVMKDTGANLHDLGVHILKTSSSSPPTVVTSDTDELIATIGTIDNCDFGSFTNQQGLPPTLIINFSIEEVNDNTRPHLWLGYFDHSDAPPYPLHNVVALRPTA